VLCGTPRTAPCPYRPADICSESRRWPIPGARRSWPGLLPQAVSLPLPFRRYTVIRTRVTRLSSRPSIHVRRARIPALHPPAPPCAA
jgi:hypothetical protein